MIYKKITLFVLLVLFNACMVENGKIVVTVKPTSIITPDEKILTFQRLGAYTQKSDAFLTGNTSYYGAGDGVFHYPWDIAIDSTNNFFYVVDVLNNRIQKFTSTGEFIGAIGFSLKSGTCSAGVQSTWCTGGYFLEASGDGGFDSIKAVKLNIALDLMFVVDAFNVQKFKLSTGQFLGAIGNSTAAGTCSAGAQATWCTGGVFSSGTGDGMFSGASGIDLNIADNYFLITDQVKSSIQKFNLTSGAFVGAIGFSTASGTCVAGQQNAWCTGGIFSPDTQKGLVNTPSDISLDRISNSFVITNYNDHTVSKFNLSTGAFIGTIGYGNGAFGTCINSKQNTWCTNGRFLWDNTRGGFYNPQGVVIDSANNLFYISDKEKVQKFILSTGAFAGIIGRAMNNSGNCISGVQSGWCTGSSSFTSTSNDGAFDSTSKLAIDFSNNLLYVTDAQNHRVQKIILSSGAFAGSLHGVVHGSSGWATMETTGSAPIGASISYNNIARESSMVIDKENNLLYVSSPFAIQKFNLTTGMIIGAIGKSTATGNCLAGKQSSWCMGGNFSTGNLDGEFDRAPNLAADVENDFLYASTNFKIQKFVLSTGAFVGAIGKSTASGNCTLGAQSTWCVGGVFSSGNRDVEFDLIQSIAFEKNDKHLYVAELINPRVQKINAITGAFLGAIGNSSLAGNCSLGSQASWCTGGTFTSSSSDGGFQSPTHIALDKTHDHFYVYSYAKIQKFSLSTGSFLGAIGKSTATGTCEAGKQTQWCIGGTFSTGGLDGQFLSNTSLGIDQDKNYLLAGGNASLQKFDLSTGEFLGAIGLSKEVGTCKYGPQSSWCTGGEFIYNSGDGMFQNIAAIEVVDSNYYILDENRLQKMSESQ